MAGEVQSFAALGLDPWLVATLSSLGITRPTPVQAACIPPALRGSDVVGAAETGTGKTAAFALPILQHLAEDPYGIFGVVLTPTRELAFQIAQHFRALGSTISIRVDVVVGGIHEMTQAASLERKPHIVIATPGRLARLVEATNHGQNQDEVQGSSLFGRVRYLVIDEADRMLEEEYISDVGTILDACSFHQRQTLLFSATMTPSIEKLQTLAAETRPDAFRFDASENKFATVQALQQHYVFMPVNMKETYLVYLLKSIRPEQTCIIFVARCDVAEQLTAMLRILGMRRVASMHSEMKQVDRVDALHALKAGTIRALIATDVASRGLDIPQVDLVINYTIPRKVATYVHRVGRTARAGRGGEAITFVTQGDIDLVHAIEERLQKKLVEFAELKDEKVMALLGATLKARQVAQMEVTDNGFMEKYDAKRKDARAAAKKRKRAERRARAASQDADAPRPDVAASAASSAKRRALPD